MQATKGNLMQVLSPAVKTEPSKAFSFASMLLTCFVMTCCCCEPFCSCCRACAILSEAAVGDILCTCHVLAALAIAAYKHEKQFVTAHQTMEGVKLYAL